MRFSVDKHSFLTRFASPARSHARREHETKPKPIQRLGSLARLVLFNLRKYGTANPTGLKYANTSLVSPGTPGGTQHTKEMKEHSATEHSLDPWAESAAARRASTGSAATSSASTGPAAVAPRAAGAFATGPAPNIN